LRRVCDIVGLLDRRRRGRTNSRTTRRWRIATSIIARSAAVPGTCPLAHRPRTVRTCRPGHATWYSTAAWSVALQSGRNHFKWFPYTCNPRHDNIIVLYQLYIIRFIGPTPAAGRPLYSRDERRVTCWYNYITHTTYFYRFCIIYQSKIISIDNLYTKCTVCDFCTHYTHYLL